MLSVLVVDDEPDLCDLLADALIAGGHTVVCAKDGREALAQAAATTFDLVLADMRLPGLDGLTLFRRLREQSPGTDMILMTGNAAVSDAVAVLKEGAFDYLTKPIQLEELSAQLARLATYRELHRDVTATRANRVPSAKLKYSSLSTFGRRCCSMSCFTSARRALAAAFSCCRRFSSWSRALFAAAAFCAASFSGEIGGGLCRDGAFFGCVASLACFLVPRPAWISWSRKDILMTRSHSPQYRMA